MLRELLMTCAIALTATSPAAADEWARSYPVSGRPTLVLRSGDADVHVTTAADKSVSLRVTTRDWKIGPHGIRVESRQVGDRVECEVREPALQLTLRPHLRAIRVDVSLPREADVNIVSADGRVALASLEGSATVRTSDGDIEATGLRGTLRLQTSDGSVRARELDGSLDARSSDGALEVEGRFDRLDLTTSDGRIEAGILAGSRIATEWRVQSGDGRVTLRVAPDLRADLDLRSGDGSIQLDAPLQVTGRVTGHAVHGRLNGGGPVLRVRTGDGAIRVEPI